MASAFINATRQMGAAVGVAVLLFVVATGSGTSNAELAAGYRTALGWAAGLAVVAAVVSLAVSERRPGSSPTPSTDG